MSKAEDISTLFRRFGGNAETYQEIVESELAGVAEQKWPMLGKLRPQIHCEAPATRKGAVAVGERQVHAFMDPPRYAAAPGVEPVALASMGVSSSPVALPAVAPEVVEATAPVAVSLAVAAPQVAVELPSRVGPSVERAILPTLFGRAAAAPVVRADIVSSSPQPALPVSVSVSASVAPQPVAVAEHLVASVLPASPATSGSGEPDLQTLFNRLVPPKVEAPAAQSAAPLKRLVKW